MVAGAKATRVRLAEVVAVLSMATDLGLGLPIEHSMRSCLVALELGRRMGMSRTALGDLYYLTLLRMAGCTVDSADYADYFGDEVAFSRDTQHLDYGDGDAFGRWVMSSFATDKPARERAAMIDRLLTYTPEKRRSNLLGHCEVARMLASRLGLAGEVADGLGFVFERWDGGGAPNGVPGERQPLGVRVMTLSNELEVHHRLGGAHAAVSMARERSGGAFDPDVVAVFCADSDSVLAVLESESFWDNLIAAEPGPARLANEFELVAAATVMADFADLKSRFLTGNSRRVADLAAAAAERLNLDAAERVALQVGALARDLGRVAISAAVWDKPGPLDFTERESVRLHAYYSERLLTRSPALTRAGLLAGLHHERLDGSGYHRGSGAAGLSVAARLIAAADSQVAMSQARPYRDALDADEVGRRLRLMGTEGSLDASAVNAVLEATGDGGPRVPVTWPAGLTDREVDVLRRIARGESIREAAAALRLAPKTVDFHLQNIYAKAGVTTRAAVTLFAVHHDLLAGS